MEGHSEELPGDGKQRITLEFNFFSYNCHSLGCYV